KTVSPAVRDQYLRNNASKFPSLNTEPRKRTGTDETQQNMPNVMERPAKQPPIRISMPVHEVVTNPSEPSARSGEDQGLVRDPAKQQPVKTAGPGQVPISRPRQPASSPVYNFNTMHNA